MSPQPPLQVAGNVIATTLAMDLTLKGRGRVQLAEIRVYEVSNGKITSEQFFMWHRALLESLRPKRGPPG